MVNIAETENTNLYVAEENKSTDYEKQTTHNVAANEGFDFTLQNLQNLYPLVQLDGKDKTFQNVKVILSKHF